MFFINGYLFFQQECSFRLQDGGSEYLQIMDLGCAIILALQGK